jgi:hypothetical protein
MIFGIGPPTPKRIWWGARAIFERNHNKRRRTDPTYVFSLLGDRQQMEGGTEQERKALAKWIENKARPALTKRLEEEGVEPSESQRIEMTLDGFEIVADPRGSHGYLYIGIWPVDVEPAKEG